MKKTFTFFPSLTLRKEEQKWGRRCSSPGTTLHTFHSNKWQVTGEAQDTTLNAGLRTHSFQYLKRIQHLGKWHGDISPSQLNHLKNFITFSPSADLNKQNLYLPCRNFQFNILGRYNFTVQVPFSRRKVAKLSIVFHQEDISY